MQLFKTIPEFREARGMVRGSLGLVPTMGYIHQGHLALVRHARVENDALAVSIFVNPTQFGPGEDFSTYPRDLERDLAILRAEGTDLVFVPSSEEMHPSEFDTWVQIGKAAEGLEGEHRPGHFRGVATVVAKLFNIAKPHRAYFGQKDGQQVAVVKRMASDLNMDVEIVVVPTAREPDGLAFSSRNVYLTTEQRKAAPTIYGALCRASRLWEEGETGGNRLRTEVQSILGEEPLITGIDYVSVADALTMEELDIVQGPALVSVAVRMGKTRLIDNVPIG